ncbi:MAG TPA: S-layer homology domain-containing protein [Thermoanaerobaculia bacterium]|nr:S-layer homology domain-containing protein [Thermoanaerobaculia bacterium]
MMANRSRRPAAPVAALLAVAVAVSGAAGRLLGACGPFTDVAADVFCPFVLEIFYLGITTGTTATTYDPTSNVTRLQMAAFLSRTVDGVLKRGSRRAALDQFWTTQNATVLGLTTVGNAPRLAASDGTDIWVANSGSNSVSRVRASDGRLLETWTGASGAYGVLVAMGSVLVSGNGKLSRIDPSQAAGATTTVATFGLGNAQGIAFDGTRIWVANGELELVTPGAALPWTTTTVTTGFSDLRGMVYDGSSVWAVDAIANRLFKLDSNGAILQTVTVGNQPTFPAFDGTNLWVPGNLDGTVTVIRASTGAILATITANNMTYPVAVAFDGQRILVANNDSQSVTLFKAADFSPLGSFPTGSISQPWGACSDGVNFWIVLSALNQLARF